MAGTSSMIVAGLTAAALATVGHLGHRAAETVPPDLRPRASGSPAPAPEGPRSGHPAAPPPRSGQGQRVVYSLGRDRVWLVDEGGAVRRTFGVSPSTVDPAPGTYRVTSRSGSVTGSDGVPVEHVVRFASVDGTAIGFSAAVDGSAPVLDPRERTGGIRETREDAAAMWTFATIGRTVVVVP
ncbi:L,D-transpeptidase [Streptomyces sp. NPDC093991]|uniref:L,D-transpeptidase n=1 Tax=unclassified Streptomyces TaxID=2593676 RepID=UPI003416EF7D